MSMTSQPDPERDLRFSELSAEAKRIGALPEHGEAEVRRLDEIVTELGAILDDLPEVRLAKLRRRMHESRGRAIDLPPKMPFAVKRVGYPGRRIWPFSAEPHVHWAVPSVTRDRLPEGPVHPDVHP